MSARTLLSRSNPNQLADGYLSGTNPSLSGLRVNNVPITGSSSGLPAASDYSSYLFYNTGTLAWETGAGEVHIGKGAGIAGVGTAGVAVGSGIGTLGTLAAGTIAVGDSALFNGGTGVNNVVIGKQAGYTAMPGQENVIVGKDAGRLGVGGNNVLLGANAASLCSGLSGVTIINAAGTTLSPPNNTTNAAYINPVRQGATVATSKMLSWDTATKEIVAAPIPSGGGLPAATTAAQYLYYDGTAWVVGSTEIRMGTGAGPNLITTGGSVAIGQNASAASDGGGAVSIGQNCALNGAGAGNIAIGYNASRTTSGAGSVAIGSLAGYGGGGVGSICIGQNAGQGSVFNGTIAIGKDAGSGSSLGDGTVVIGDTAANQGAGINCIVIGKNAGQTADPLDDAIVIGDSAAQNGQAGQVSVSIGPRAAQSGSGTGDVAIGYFAGATSAPGGNNVLVGTNAGRASIGANNICIGAGAAQAPTGAGAALTGCTVINASSTALNPPTGSANSVFINPVRQAATGGTSKMLTWDTSSKEIVAAPLPSGGGVPNGTAACDTLYWNGSAWTSSGDNLNMGRDCGISVGGNTVGIGKDVARYGSLGLAAMAMGWGAAGYGCGAGGVVLGNAAGYAGSGIGCVLIGALAGGSSSPGSAIGNNNVCVGAGAGQHESNPPIGDYNLLLGTLAARNNSVVLNNTIMLNATGAGFDAPVSGGFYVKPIRPVATGATSRMLTLNTTTNEITSAPCPRAVVLPGDGQTWTSVGTVYTTTFSISTVTGLSVVNVTLQAASNDATGYLNASNCWIVSGIPTSGGVIVATAGNPSGLGLLFHFMNV